MSDTTETGAEMVPAATEPAPPGDDTSGTNPDADSADEAEPRNREAAKWRRRLRDLEAEVTAEREQWTAERGHLAARLELLHRAEVERQAASVLADPADVWRDGTTLDQLLDSDGNLDPHKVTDTVKALAAKHPHWKISRRPATLDGQRSGATGQHTGQKIGWRDAFVEAE